MNERRKNYITFEYLEEQLRKAILEEQDYKLRNYAKFRAVNQNVATYKDFKDMVDAAHLRPLEKPKKDVELKPTTSWNPLVSQKNNCFNANKVNSSKNQTRAKVNPKTSVEFLHMWKKSCLTNHERYQLIKNLDEDVRITILTSETMACGVGDIIPVLLELQDELEDVELAVGLLTALVNTKRFTLSLAFLTEGEKSECLMLFSKLQENIQRFEENLMQKGITKTYVEELKRKYKVN